MTVIKICGITALEDALLAAELGADLLGFNFYPPSPRYVTPEAARSLTDALRAELGEACPALVGVFVNAPDAVAIAAAAGLDAAQLHGDEAPDVLAGHAGRAFKAIRPRDAAEARQLCAAYAEVIPADPRLPTLLVDAYHKALYGGTGEQAGLDVALAAVDATPRLTLAGGLTPDNVAARVAAIRPWGVDVASGVEGADKRRKDPDRLQAFFEAVHGA